MLGGRHTANKMLFSHTTKYTADSIEASPKDRDLFVCGTYELEEENKKRIGDVTLFKVVTDGESAVIGGERSCDKSLTEKGRVEVGGVLDMKWSAVIGGNNTVLCATAQGELVTIAITDDESLDKVDSTKISEGILLAVDKKDRTVVTSDTTGNIHHLIDNDKVCTIKAHGHGGWGAEVWALALSPSSAHTVYTGGDDCLFKLWDVRLGNAGLIYQSRHHDMGVCCIAPSPNSDYIFLTGSYDESVCVWDNRTYKMLGNYSVGGGVWRLKWHQTQPYILVAGMHSGFHIINIHNIIKLEQSQVQEEQLLNVSEQLLNVSEQLLNVSEQLLNVSLNQSYTGHVSLELNQSYTGHQSLAYGADWLANGVVATCSFYDRLLHVWDSGMCDPS